MISGIADTRDIRPLTRPVHVAIAACLLVAVDVGARILPHHPGVTPLVASALFAGLLMPGRWAALLVPLAAMLISDLVIGIYDWRVMAVVYAAIAAPALLGSLGRARYGVAVLGGLALGSSLLFFAASNFAVWLFDGRYALNLDGLILCYTAALPFLKNAVQGDLLWTAVFLTAYRLGQGLFARHAASARSAW